MSTSASVRGPVARGNSAAPARATHALTPGESAWLAAIPCALIVLAAILVVGPPLGRTLFTPRGVDAIWPRFDYQVHPEPTEHARYLLSLLGPLLLVGGLLLLRGRRVHRGFAAAAVIVAQLGLGAFVVVCVAGQRMHVYSARPQLPDVMGHTRYFTVATLAIAVALAALAAAVLRRPALVARLADATRETRSRKTLAIVIAALVTLAYLLSVYNTEASVGRAHIALWSHVSFWSDEAFAILNGQAPLVDFNAQYGHLWAYLAAGGLTLLGASFGAYFAIMLAGTAGTMAAVFATLRRVVGGSSLQALALFLPVLATGFFMKIGPPANRYSPASLLSLFPIRYAGPYVLLWLLVRRVDAGSARRSWALLALAGLVTINNPEFGVPAYGATLAVLLWALPERSARALARLAVDVLLGAALALAIVSALTLAVGGSLPHFGMLLTFPRIFGIEGFGLMRMPSIGLHLVVYVTFVAAIAVASVQTAGGERNALTAALGWIGIFGLGAGAYFTGRSHPHVLIDLFSVWALALALLGVVTVRAIARRPSRRPLIAEWLVLAGLGVMVCSLAQIPTPWSQVDRLRHGVRRDVWIVTQLERTLDQVTEPGEPVALLVRFGHKMAEDIGVVDVLPYANMESMLTRQQWSEMDAALKRAHGRKVFLETITGDQPELEWMTRHGYRPFIALRELDLLGFIKDPRPASARP